MDISDLLNRLEVTNRPSDYIDIHHCEECEEHYNELRPYASESLPYSAIENIGWDPTCFLSPLGFRYYLSALIRLSNENHDWIDTLMSRLTGYQRPGLTPNDLEIVRLILVRWNCDSTIDAATKIEINRYLNDATA